MPMPSITVKVTSGATVPQGVVAKGGGKKLHDYKNTAAIIYLDKEDLKKLGILSGTSVEIRNKNGSVIVTAMLTPDGPHPGVAFMPRGPWVNIIIDNETRSSGCPMYKETEVEIEPKPKMIPLEMADLMRQQYIEQV